MNLLCRNLVFIRSIYRTFANSRILEKQNTALSSGAFKLFTLNLHEIRPEYYQCRFCVHYIVFVGYPFCIWDYNFLPNSAVFTVEYYSILRCQLSDFFISPVHTVHLTFATVILNLEAILKILCFWVFSSYSYACLKPCSRILGTEWYGELGNIALMCFSVVLG